MSGDWMTEDFSIEELIESAFGDVQPFDGMERELDYSGSKKIAMAVLGVALTNELDRQSKGILRGTFDCLAGTNDGYEWRLKLVRRKRGSYKTFDQRKLQEMIDVVTLRLVEWTTKQTGKQEVAIQDAMDRDNVDRSTVFARLKRAREFDKRRDEMQKKVREKKEKKESE
jgi:hypothetical protein